MPEGEWFNHLANERLCNEIETSGPEQHSPVGAHSGRQEQRKHCQQHSTDIGYNRKIAASMPHNSDPGTPIAKAQGLSLPEEAIYDQLCKIEAAEAGCCVVKCSGGSWQIMCACKPNKAITQFFTLQQIAGLGFALGASLNLDLREASRGNASGAVGDSGAKAVEIMLAGASQRQERILATMIGIVTLLLGATGVVVQLKDALNTVWEIETPAGSGVWGFVRSYVVSLAGVLGLGFLLLISLLLTTTLSAGANLIATFLPEPLCKLLLL